MTTLLPDRPAPMSTSTPFRQVVAWVDEQPLSEQRAHLRVGQELRAVVAPADRDLTSGVLLGLAAGGCWQVHPGALGEAPPVGARSVTGVVAGITAVIVPHRPRGLDGWEPVPGAARTREVVSTCTPEMTRSVWIPSGRPVLLGFLLTVANPLFTHSLG